MNSKYTCYESHRYRKESVTIWLMDWKITMFDQEGVKIMKKI